MEIGEARYWEKEEKKMQVVWGKKRDVGTCVGVLQAMGDRGGES